MRYEIDENLAIRMYNDGESVPFMFQPDYPNFDKFDDLAEATAWAEMAMAVHSDENAPNAPLGKGLAPEPRVKTTRTFQ